MASARLLTLLLLLCPWLSTTFSQDHEEHEHPAHVHTGDNHYRFIENDGQWDASVNYKAHFQSGNLWLQKNALTYGFYDANVLAKAHGKADFEYDPKEPLVKYHNIRVSFMNALPDPVMTPAEQMPEYYNFFQGRDRSKWKGGVNAFKEVKYENLYEDIDLSFYTSDEFLKYDFIVRSYANPSKIQLKYEGADKVSINRGNLIVTTSINVMVEEAPFAFQIIDGKQVEVPCKYVLDGDVVSFAFPKGYDETYDLIIDPTLIFSTFSGSYADNFGMTATYDLAGNLFSGGTVFDNGFDTTLGAYDTWFNGTPAQSIVDVVLTKYTADGSAMIYSTYFGGVETETPHSIIINSQDELCVYGVTSSLDFPVTPNAYDTTFNGGSSILWVPNGTDFNFGTDIYVSRFSQDGTALLASTFIGGSGNDGVNYIDPNNAVTYDSLFYNYGDQFRGEIMVDDLDNIYVATSTRSTDFPIVNGFDNTLNGPQDGAFIKFDPLLTNLQASSYIGGSATDAAYNIKVDDTYQIYITGGTGSTNFPFTAGSYQTAHQGGESDGFVMKIDPTGANILASSYVGTPDYDQSYFLQIDPFGKVYLYGQTEGAFPVSAGVYSNPNSGQFFAKFDNDFTTLELSTVFGNSDGTVNISPAAFLVDFCGNVYATGWGGKLIPSTDLFGMPLTNDAYQDETGGYDGNNFYLIVLTRGFNALHYGSYFGGDLSSEHVDGGTSRFDPNGIVYQSVCAGCGGNSDFPYTPGAYSATNNAGGQFCNNGMFKFDFEIIPIAEFTPDIIEGCSPLTVFFNNESPPGSIYTWDFGNTDTSNVFSPTQTYTTPGTYEVWLFVTDTVCNLTDSTLHTIVVYDPMPTFVTADTVLCTLDPLTLTGSAPGATSFVWSSNSNFTDTLNANPGDSVITINPTGSNTYYFSASGQFCTVIDSVVVSYFPELFGISPDENICIGDTVNFGVSALNPTLNASYSWTPTASIVSGQNSQSMFAVPDTTTTYTVVITDPNGCIYSMNVTVNVFDFGSTAFGAYADQDTLLAGESTWIHADPALGGFTYTWVPDEFLSHPDSSSTFATPESTTTYTVTISSNGCSRSGTVTLWVLDEECGEPDIFIPNAFTPDGNGENDVLFIRGNNIEALNFQVFNRWGEKVFETTDQSIGWDGTYKGMKADPAVFVYHLQITCVGGFDYFKKGNITLIR